MKKIIYAVNSGSYSDYRIVALFSTKKAARTYMSAVKDSDYNDIEEYELDPDTADLIRRGYSVWRVRMLRDGTVEKVDRTDNDSYDVQDIGDHIWERTKAPAYKGKGIQDALESTVWAKTEKAAIKIANEHRTQMVALGKWK